MSKNMTRKGLAFGAGLALVTSGLVGLPAQANGTVNGSVTLLPSAGTTYGALSIGHFDLVGDFTSAVAGNGDLKFLVDAPAGSVKADASAVFSLGTITATATAANPTVVTVTTENNHGLANGDVITASGAVDGGNVGSAATVNGDRTVTVVNAKQFTFTGGDASTGAATVTALAIAVKDYVGTLATAKVIRDNTLGNSAVIATAEAIDLIDTGTSSDNFFVVDTGRNSTIPNYTIRLVANDTTVNSSATVTAWLDDDNDNIIDAAEVASTPRTISFTKDAVPTVVITPTVLNATALEATVSFDRDVNLRMLESYVAVQFDKATAAIAGADATAGSTVSYGSDKNPSLVSWQSATSTFAARLSSITGLTAGTFGARVMLWDGAGSLISDYATASGLRSTFTLGTAVADVIEISATQVAGSVISTSTTNEVDETAAVDAADYADSTAIGVAKVLEETTSVTVNVFVGNNTIQAPGQASVPVALIAAITGGGAGQSTGITTADNIRINGETFPGSAAKTFLANTNASGVASFVISNVNGTAGDKLYFTYNVQGVTGAGATAAFSVEWEAPTYAAIDTDDTAGNAVRSITAGATFTMNYTVTDQWGAAPKNNTQRVVGQAINSAARTKAAVITASAPVVDGKASLTVTDNGTGTGQFQFVVDAVGNNTASASPYDVTTTVNVVANATAATITPAALVRTDYGTAQYNDINNDGDTADTDEVDNRTRLVLSARTFANYDGRIAQITLAPNVETTRAVTLRGTVTNSAAAAVAGTPVTLAAKGFQFKAGSVWSKDSITVITSATGTYSVQVWSQVGGEQTITITSGAASTTQKLTYAAGTATAASFEIAAVATSLPGKTVDVKVSVKDKFGNPAQGVAVALRSTGPGYLLQTSITTDKAGEAFTKLLVGASESGSAVVTATMTIAGVETSKAVTVVVGAPEPVAKIGSFNGRVAVRVENAKGSTISVKIGRTWYKYNALNDNYLQSWRSAKGRSVAVSVYVDGELQNVQTITVK